MGLPQYTRSHQDEERDDSDHLIDRYVCCSDEFELDFSGSSELWSCQAELGHFDFRAENEQDFF